MSAVDLERSVVGHSEVSSTDFSDKAIAQTSKYRRLRLAAIGGGAVAVFALVLLLLYYWAVSDAEAKAKLEEKTKAKLEEKIKLAAVAGQCCGATPFGYSCSSLESSKSSCSDDGGIVAINQSYATQCAEVDNIKIAFKRASNATVARRVRIHAQQPRYTNSTMFDYREAIWNDCTTDSMQQAKERDTLCDTSWAQNEAGYFVFSGIQISSTVEVSLTCDPGWNFGHAPFQMDNKTYPFTMLEMKFQSDAGVWNTNFVLYSNGYTRLIPMPPVGLNTWIPFGSSVVIGPSSDAFFPWSPLGSVTLVATSPPRLELTYDSTWQTTPVQLTIGASPAVGTIDVFGLSWSSQEHAYLRYSSMFVRQGKSDADTITSADGITRPLIVSAPFPAVEASAWTKLPGPFWGLTKQCVSIHNTRAPDIFVTADCASN